MRWLRAIVFAAGFAAGAPSQQDVVPPWRWCEVPGTDAVAFAVLWPTGLDDDPDTEHGAARVLGECRLLRAQAAVAEVLGSGVQVLGDATVAFVLVRAEQWQSAVRFVEALVDDTGSIDDDGIARATARAALAADDAEWLFPGSVLACRARAALLAGPAARPIAGTARALQQLDPARVRARLQQPLPFAMRGLGVAPPLLQEAIDAMPARSVVRVASRHPVRAAAVPTPGTTSEHPRLDGPLVAAAFVVHEVDPAALAVAIEVARARAARTLRLRGRELVARAPLVAWSWLHGEPLVLFQRRGADGAPVDAPRRELEDLLADLRARPPSAAELAAAIETLRQEVQPTGGPAIAEALPARAVAMLLADYRAARADAVLAVNAAAAHGALAAVCAEERTWWGALAPAPSRGTAAGW